MKVHAIQRPLSTARVQRCCQCDALFTLPPLNGDRALLFEALANLLSNSIKFTPPGGTVILRGVNDAGHTRIDAVVYR